MPYIYIYIYEILRSLYPAWLFSYASSKRMFFVDMLKHKQDCLLHALRNTEVYIYIYIYMYIYFYIYNVYEKNCLDLFLENVVILS